MRHISESIQWKGRDAVRLANGSVELISLTHGGHLACFRFLDWDGQAGQNVLWEAPWTTFDADREWSPDMLRLYGPPETGRFLAGYTGHALCLDYFGEPDAEKTAAGLGLHGEAAHARWNVMDSAEPLRAQCGWTVNLPVSQLAFERQIYLGDGQSVAYVQETVSNERALEHRFDWVQHVTFGPPFLSKEDSTLNASVQSGITSPLGYEGKSLVADNCAFSWPFAPCQAGDRAVDLRQPFIEAGKGCLAGLKLDPERKVEYLLCINWRLGLGAGYCFRRCDFPWMTIWEENCARQGAPWNGNTQARGMEFGTTPLPMSPNGNLPDECFSDVSRGCRISAHGLRSARYMMFLFAVPAHVRSIVDIVPAGDHITLYDASGTRVLSVPAEGCEEFLA